MGTPTSSSTVTFVSGSDNEVVGRRSVQTVEIRRWRTLTVRKNYDDHSLRMHEYHMHSIQGSVVGCMLIITASYKEFI
ncbi:hypothetical protein EVAR_52907_1 [Eumeta japonica]|uniref:Uncharacterized protein n=1 Tax=Eumeta variegata TaxID=151549 RepID=A0A4C1Y3J9_EUMVA|nr:hypothetical protein EVAR_52907_1 [Eumeta japonica]